MLLTFLYVIGALATGLFLFPLIHWPGSPDASFPVGSAAGGVWLCFYFLGLIFDQPFANLAYFAFDVFVRYAMFAVVFFENAGRTKAALQLLVIVCLLVAEILFHNSILLEAAFSAMFLLAVLVSIASRLRPPLRVLVLLFAETFFFALTNVFAFGGALHTLVLIVLCGIHLTMFLVNFETFRPSLRV